MDQPSCWKRMSAVKWVNNLLIQPVLALARNNDQNTTDLNAHRMQLWGVMLQEQKDETKHRIGYWPRALMESEQTLVTPQGRA